MTQYVAPICVVCTHFRGWEQPSAEHVPTDDNPLTGTCDAFPTHIPLAIFHGARDHRRPFRGDHDIQFAPRDDDAAEYADMIFTDPHTGKHYPEDRITLNLATGKPYEVE